jgi:hypothetical protein
MDLTMAKLSPWGRNVGGKIEFRSPLANLATLTPPPGMVVFVSVLIGSTGYDGFSNSSLWVRSIQNSTLPGIVLGTLGLLGFIAVVLGSYTGACLLAGRLTDTPRRALPGLFLHSLAHRPRLRHRPLPHATHPGRATGLHQYERSAQPGLESVGTAQRGVDASIVNYPGLIGSIQAGAIVTRQVLGVILAHNRALALFPRRAALTGQMPLLLVMVGYTVAALLLLFTE